MGFADRAVTVTSSLVAARTEVDGLGYPLVLGDVPFDGSDTYRLYTSTTAAAVDLAASEITQTVHDQIVAILSQSPGPSQVYVAAYDGSGGDTPDDALTAFQAAGFVAGEDFFFVLTDSRTPSEIATLSTAVQALDAMLVAQDDDADWLTSGVPSAYSGVVSNNQTMVIYHDTDSVEADAAAVGVFAGQDPDVRRPSFRAVVSGGSAYATALTSTQRANLQANNATEFGLMRTGSNQLAVWTLAMLDGTAPELVFTKKFSEIRIRQALATMFQEYAQRPEDIPGDLRGERIAASYVDEKLQAALDAGHLVSTEAAPKGYALTYTASGSSITVAGTLYTVRGVVSVSVNYDLES